MESSTDTQTTVEQPAQNIRVSSRTPKRKAFFDEEEPRSSVKSFCIEAENEPVTPPVAEVKHAVEPKVRRTSLQKVKSDSAKAKKRCDKGGCSGTLPICFVNATERCSGNGYTSRWYHISPAEHFCNDCFEYYYRSHKDGYQTYADWKMQWSSNSKSEASIRNFMIDQVLPFWVQCTLSGCRKWRQLSRDMEFTPDFISRYMCGMSTHGVKRVKDVGNAAWRQLQIPPSLLRKSPAIDHLGSTFFPDRVGLSPLDESVRNYFEGKATVKESGSLVQPFCITLEPMRAQSFSPAGMLPLEEAEFPGYVREPVIYLGLRNLVLAIWASNTNEWVTFERCVPHVICRGIVRLRYIQDLKDIIYFLTRHGFINCGLLSPPPEGTFQPKINDQQKLEKKESKAEKPAQVQHICSSSSSDVRKYDTVPCCYFCQAYIKHKLCDHLRDVHSDVVEVVRILALDKKNKRERKNAFSKLGNLGAFKHNIKVLIQNVGELILPCPSCYGFCRKKDLWRHHKKLRLKKMRNRKLKKLLLMRDMVQVMGKCNRRVPVLIPDDCQPAMKWLVQHRSSFGGIPEGNTFFRTCVGKWPP